MFGVYLRVRILTFFVIKVLKEVLLKKNKNNICSHTFCDFILLWWIPHGAPIAIFATFSSVIFRYSYTNIVCTNKKASGLIFWCSFPSSGAISTTKLLFPVWTSTRLRTIRTEITPETVVTLSLYGQKLFQY